MARVWPAATAAVMVASLAAVAVGEWLGWPFLAAPLERALSTQLDRRVSLGGPPTRVPAVAGAGGASAARAEVLAPSVPVAPSAVVVSTDTAEPFRIRFFGGLRISAGQVEIAAPAWSQAGPSLLAHDVNLELRYIDLWRAHRGEPLRIEALQARSVAVNAERTADGRTSWQLGRTRLADTAVAPPLPMPSFGRLDVAAGTLRYRDQPRALSIDAVLSWVDAVAPRKAGLRVTATGFHRELPLKIELLSTGLLPAVTPASAAASAVPVGVSLKAVVGRASLDFEGSALDPLRLGGLSGHFIVKGPSLAAVGDPLGVTLPSTAAFRTEGDISRQGPAWAVVIDAATVGASQLRGRFKYQTDRRVPLLSGQLGGARLLLVDLGPVVGVTPGSRGKARVLPDRPFDLAALRAMDADVAIDIAEVDFNTGLLEPVRPLRGHLKLSGGVLTVDQLDARAAEGRLSGSVQLDGRGAAALWRTDLRWADVRLERWVRQGRAKTSAPLVTGRVSGRANLQGQGLSTADILADLKGEVRSELREGTVSHLVVEAAGLDLAEGLGLLFGGDDVLAVPCAVADLVAQGGVLRPRLMVLDTRDSAIWVDGSISLASEAMDLRLVVSPKDFSPLTLRSPLRVRGTFAAPSVSLDRAPIARKVATALLLGLINPLAVLIPMVDPGDADEARRGAEGCRGLSALGKAKPAAR